MFFSIFWTAYIPVTLLYRVPEIVTRGRFPDGGESDSTWRTPEALRAAPDACSPRCEAEALDQKIDESPHLGSLMTPRRQQRIQWVALRILRVLQQGLQQSLMDGARDHMLAQP